MKGRYFINDVEVRIDGYRATFFLNDVWFSKECKTEKNDVLLLAARSTILRERGLLPENYTHLSKEEWYKKHTQVTEDYKIKDANGVTI